MDKVQKMIARAEQLAKQGIWDDNARKINMAILRSDKKNSGAYCRLGRCLEEGGDLIEAKKAYKNALTLNPICQGYRNSFNRIEEKIKDEADTRLVESIEKYEEAFQIGITAKASDDFKLAITALEKAVLINHQLMHILLSLHAIGPQASLIKQKKYIGKSCI